MAIDLHRGAHCEDSRRCCMLLPSGSGTATPMMG